MLLGNWIIKQLIIKIMKLLKIVSMFVICRGCEEGVRELD